MTTFAPSIGSAFSQTAFDFPTSSPEVSPAKTFLWRAVSSGLKLKEAAYGRRSFDLLAIFDPLSSSWKTSQTSLLDPATGPVLGSAEFSETWPRSGMTRSGIAYRLPLSALHTVETGCGFWPTPNKSNGFAPFSTLTMLRKQSGLPRPSGAKMGFDLKWEPRAVPYLVDGWIDPILSEWLMGYPIGHTALPDAETP